MFPSWCLTPSLLQAVRVTGFKIWFYNQRYTVTPKPRIRAGVGSICRGSFPPPATPKTTKKTEAKVKQLHCKCKFSLTRCYFNFVYGFYFLNAYWNLLYFFSYWVFKLSSFVLANNGNQPFPLQIPSLQKTKIADMSRVAYKCNGRELFVEVVKGTVCWMTKRFQSMHNTGAEILTHTETWEKNIFLRISPPVIMWTWT